MGLIKVSEAADYLKVHPEVIRRWLREKKIPGYKVGKEWRIAREDIDALLKNRKNQ